MLQIRKANERGHADHGWLDSYHTFSFANYHDPRFMGYRSLRVINEDRVAGNQGFGTHPHQDFEIVSYVISGALKHEDSMGHKAVMRSGEVQRITAGTGIAHSEYNNSATDEVHFLQIWFVPAKRGLAPNYAQQSFSEAPPSGLTLACSKDGRADSILINQDVDLYIGRLDPKEELTHPLKSGRHAWVQLIEGDLVLNSSKLSAGDGASVDGENELRLAASTGAHFLLFDLA
jgi:redox-sensitive bicupin YhaK (pirin superfamily)